MSDEYVKRTLIERLFDKKPSDKTDVVAIESKPMNRIEAAWDGFLTGAMITFAFGVLFTFLDFLTAWFLCALSFVVIDLLPEGDD